ncbi:MAG: type II toxin-antitoxin system Phd/YefM family antitoxin [Clostridia bacterium]|nr:type II toxin-antitoxin system Phd/YefM family antitoxin [Clostridia bacterium]
MTAVSIVNFSKNAAEYLTHAVKNQDVISVTTENGTAVILSEEEFRGMLETIALLRAAGMPERVEEARSTPVEESDDFAW